MSLQSLPQEVLEILFLYVEVQDLLTVWKVVDFEGSAFFWTTLCKREGYKNILAQGHSWKDVFYHNINWVTQKYVKREYIFDGYFKNKFDYFDVKKELLHRENLVLHNIGDEISIWNIDKSPVLIQRLSERILRVNKNQFLSHHLENVKLYSLISNTYYEYLNLKVDMESTDLVNHYALTDEYFAAFDEIAKSVKVIDIETSDIFTLPFSSDHQYKTSIAIIGDVLNLMEFQPSRNILKRCNLKKRELLVDLNLSHEGPFDKCNLEISSNLLVVWMYSSFHKTSATAPIKVWKSNGELIKSLSLPLILPYCSHLTHLDRIFWLFVEGGYIIFSINTTNVTIWSSKDPDVCKRMYKDGQFYVGQDVISSHLLVLSYKSYFKVVDFQKAAYLYTVQFDSNRPNNASHALYQEYVVNQYFYVCIKAINEEKNEQCKVLRLYSNEPCILTIYDFRNQSVGNC